MKYVQRRNKSPNRVCSSYLLQWVASSTSQQKVRVHHLLLLLSPLTRLCLSGPTYQVQPIGSNLSGPTYRVQPIGSNLSGPTYWVQPIWQTIGSNLSGPTYLGPTYWFQPIGSNLSGPTYRIQPILLGPTYQMKTVQRCNKSLNRVCSTYLLG